MASIRSLAFGLLVATSGVASSPVVNTHTLQINTTVGTVQGSINSTFPNVAQFLNIPFAEPPQGKLRFAPPVPKVKVDGIINGTVGGPACHQNARSTPDIHSYSASGLNYHGPQSEDCLSISVWTPYGNRSSSSGSDSGLKSWDSAAASSSSSSSKLPVLVWIYGGGFDMGANTGIPYYGPSTWIQSSQELIIVEMKYVVAFPAALLTLTRTQLPP